MKRNDAMRSFTKKYFYSIIGKRFFSLLIVLSPLFSFCQIPSSLVEKFSPVIRQSLPANDHKSKHRFIIQVSDTSAFTAFIGKQRGIIPLYEYTLTKTYLIQTTWKEIIDHILPRPEVVFIDQQRIAKEEVAVSNLDLSTNKCNLLYHRFPQYNGEGISISVKENKPDTTDPDFKGRYIYTPTASATLSSHATIMSTIIAGAGNSYYEGKGVSPAATLSSTSFPVLLPEPDSYYQQYGISVQNHSYGTGIENFYGADAAAYDAYTIARPSVLQIFSAGNSGTQTAIGGNYNGIANYSNLTGSFKMAKNIITVGHTDSLMNVLAPSSRGPAYDGRIKPELVAFGEDGSSGAAAIVSGIAVSLQHAYKQINGALPPAALIKSILLNSADDVNAKGIDFKTGYGSANAIKAMETLVQSRYTGGTVSNGADNTHNITIPANAKQLKITLVWSDPASAANTAKALRNDLDLELALPSASQNWLPWVLNHYPHLDSLQQLPQRKRDSLNNAEQVTIDNPAAGNYVIHVKGYNLTATSSQQYYIAWQVDTLNTFHWYYPVATDNIFGGRANVLRWEWNGAVINGQLEYSVNNGTSWQTISSAIDLSANNYKWNAPDTFSTALLRMTTIAPLVSDTFTISKRFNVSVGFNCPDSFLLYWNTNRGVNNNRVYRLGGKYLEPIMTTSDTMIVLAKATNPATYYAVAPVLGNKTGVRSYGFDYTTQSTGCYLRSFFAQLVNTSALLDLELGTTYGLQSIIIEKLTTAGYQPIQTINNIAGTVYSFTDASLHTGANTYRIKLLLRNGTAIYSQPETVYYFTGDRLLYPNPVLRGQPFYIISDNADNAKAVLYNSAGVRVAMYILDEGVETIDTGKLSAGVYFLKIEGKPYKVVVY
ncbi:MAG TPA: S8 family peptidase [Chitinophagaceae bacterium]|nr:S8 family peptidase [Chitinophagaceae bacterium]